MTVIAEILGAWFLAGIVTIAVLNDIKHAIHTKANR